MTARLAAMAALAAVGGTMLMATDGAATETELKAAYCIPILKYEAALAADIAKRGDDWLRSAEKQGLDPERRRSFGEALVRARELVREREGALSRMQSHLLPRVAYAESAAWSAAASRAQSDLDAIRELPEKCLRQCDRVADPVGCTSRCSALEPDLQTRLEACRAPSWLPAPK